MLLFKGKKELLAEIKTLKDKLDTISYQYDKAIEVLYEVRYYEKKFKEVIRGFKTPASKFLGE